MPRQQYPDLSLDIPRDWQDRTMIAFAATKAVKSSTVPNVVVTRDTLGDSPDLKRYADRQLIELAKRVDGFVPIERRATQLGGQEAVELRFESKGSDEPIVQRLIMTALPSGQVVSLTSTAAKSDAGDLDATFDRICASVTLTGKTA
jgi:hypothetical protein